MIFLRSWYRYCSGYVKMRIIRKLVIASIFSVVAIEVQAQTIIVTPDGRHSIAINHGKTSTIINPDGTHATAIHHGKTSTIVNPDGTHAIGINHGNTAIIVNPDGTHAIATHQRNISTKVKSHSQCDIGHGLHNTHRTDAKTMKDIDTVSVASPIGAFFKKILGTKKRPD